MNGFWLRLWAFSTMWRLTRLLNRINKNNEQ